VKLDGIQLAGHDVTQVDSAIVDSGTSLLVGPKHEVDKIAQTVGATRLPTGQYMIDCNTKLPALDFVIGGQKYTLEGQDYLINSNGVCLFALMGMDIPAPAGPLWILSDVFMRKYYTIFNYAEQKVGIAPIALCYYFHFNDDD